MVFPDTGSAGGGDHRAPGFHGSLRDGRPGETGRGPVERDEWQVSGCPNPPFSHRTPFHRAGFLLRERFADPEVSGGGGYGR
ncbi:hypothetical protein GCM10027160_09140 [Streptomyces calidiresistens]